MATSHVLFERDTNIQAQPQNLNNEKPKSMDYHRQMLEERLKDSNGTQNYISPSDTIMSPATQKLAAFKNKHMTKGSTKTRSLFAQTASRNANAAAAADSSQRMFADMPSK